MITAPTPLDAARELTRAWEAFTTAQACALPLANYLAEYGVERLGDTDAMVVAYRDAMATVARCWDAYVTASAMAKAGAA